MKHLRGKTVVIFDLDDTLSDTTDRRHWLDAKIQPEGKANWDAFFEDCHQDQPRAEMVALALEASQKGAALVIFSGRGAAVEGKTRDWLGDLGLEPQLLMMRPKGSFKKSAQMKREWLMELRDAGAVAIAAFDDESSNLEMFEAEGLWAIDAKDPQRAIERAREVFELISAKPAWRSNGI